MKQVICRNPKGYRLTQGREYTVNDELREGYYQLQNDNNRTVFYADDLFEDVPTESTVEEIIQSMAITISDVGAISVRYNVDGNDRTLNYTLSITRTQNSCGIGDVSGINGLVNHINQHVINRQDLRIQFLRKVVETFVDNFEFGLFLFSTNIDGNDNITAIDEVLTNLSLARIQKLNPNSGNQIALWILEKDDEEDVTVD